MSNATTKCLIQNHQIRTIADALKMTTRLRNPTYPRPHEHIRLCICQDCVHDRARLNCSDPHKCATKALEIIKSVFPKMNPLHQGGWHGDLSLTSSRKRANLRARDQNDPIIFDPSMTAKNDLTECFRIFSDPTKISKNPAQRRVTPGTGLRHATIEVYTDGACINNGKKNARSGSGIWFGQNNPRNSAIKIPGNNQSNQVGETVAIIQAVTATPTFCPLRIVSDSKYAINGLTTNLSHWEDKGWIRVKNAELFQKAAYLLRQRTAITSFKWVKGHQGNLGNEESDKLAKNGAEKDLPDQIDLQIPDEFLTQGAKLQALDQATAYQGIRQIKSRKEPPVAAEMITKTRDAIERYTGESETDETIWMSIRKPILRTRVQQFLYKTLHQTHMVGSIWGHIPGFGHRKYCTTCFNVDSMEHILTRCPVNTREITWDLAKKTWPHGREHWPEISLGLILGTGCINIPWQRPQPQQANQPERRTPTKWQGATRLLQILISEAAHLVWVLRCERVIQNKQHTDNETKARWLRAINERLTCDRITATKIKRNTKFTNLVKHTWGPILLKQRNTPHNWIHRREVLVGSGSVN